MKHTTTFNLPLTDLLTFVKRCCHENLHDNLVALRDHSHRWIHQEGSQDRIVLAEHVLAFIRSIQGHLAHEENTFFPMIELGARKGPALYPIDDLIEDHAELIVVMHKIKSLAGGLEVTPDMTSDCVSYYEKLLDLERLLLNHIQIENQILHPMLQKIS